MSDLTERLRKPMNRDEFFKVADGLCREAADTIDRLTRELAEARDKALEEAAKVADEAASQMAIMCHQEVERALAAEALAAGIRALKEKP